MKGGKAFLACLLAALATIPLAAQTATPSPVLSSIEAPHPAVQNAVRIAGNSYARGAVPYGPAGTPLVISGKDFGGGGTVQFISYYNTTRIQAARRSRELPCRQQ